jgi:hypothetical protein
VSGGGALAAVAWPLHWCDVANGTVQANGVVMRNLAVHVRAAHRQARDAPLFRIEVAPILPGNRLPVLPWRNRIPSSLTLFHRGEIGFPWRRQ